MLFTIEYVKLFESPITNMLHAISFEKSLEFVREGIQSLRYSDRLPHNGTSFCLRTKERNADDVEWCCLSPPDEVILSPQPRRMNWSSRGIQTKTVAFTCFYRQPQSSGTYQPQDQLPSALPSLAACKVASDSNLHNAGTTQAALEVLRP